MSLSKLSATVTALLLSTSLMAPTVNAQEEGINAAQKAVRMQQFPQAYKLYGLAARAGNPDAQYQLATMLLNGIGVKKNEPKAVEWLKKASVQSHAAAQFTLSRLITDDPKQSKSLLESAAAQGYASAITQLNRTSTQEAPAHSLTSIEKQWFGAARNNDISTMQSLLDDGNELNSTDGAGRHALFYAAEFNSSEALDWLVQQGIDIDLRDKNGLTAIQNALAGGHKTITQSLLKAGSNPNQTFSNGDNLLHYAIRLRQYTQVSAIMSAGVKINHRNKDGWTALDLAEFQKTPNTVSALKKKGAKKGIGWQQKRAPQDVVDVAKQLEKDTRSPAVMAIINNNERLLAQILRQDPSLANAVVDNNSSLLILAAKQNKPKMIKVLIDHGANINHTAYKNTSALHVAARLGLSNIVTTLLESGASPTQMDSSNKDALSNAIAEKQFEIAHILIDRILGDEDDTRAIRDKLKINATPINDYILLAVQHKSDEIVERLLPYANKAPSFDKQQRSALWYAVKHSKTEIIEKLLNSGISASLADSLGRTPLMIAIEQSCLICAIKLRPSSDLNHKSNNGNTALILAALAENAEMSAWLIKNKVDIDARNQRGDTALIIAVKGNVLNVAQQLIKAKANPDRKNKLGFSAFDLAENASPEMVKLLKDNSVFGVF